LARVVGLTGGIGSGKSEALAAFARHGAVTLSSDDIVHRLYDLPEVRQAVAEQVGADILAADGSIDRPELGRRAFADPELLRFLEALLLPLVAERFAAWRDDQVAGGAALLVHEAPTLFEAGVEDRYDAIVTITAPEDVREQRRPGAAARMARQLPEAEKAARSDYVYRNTGTLEQLDEFVAGVIRDLGAA